ncbi:MAG TPA: DNA-3-methyladenine glycosylase 2 family protein [Candidatus Polarisedimenticolia bacterium]|nr:DNA-3-methyladenine glycosylase 2 family protein [Candidatus Polarisedimenticolia bacterium]
MNARRAVARPLTPARLREAAQALAARDRDLAGILERHGPPPLWGRPRGFASLVQIILEQQVSLASARAILKRLVATVGEPTPARLFEAGEARLRACGLTRQKAAYCHRLAAAALDGRLDLDVVGRLDDEQAIELMTRHDGVGPWTAQVYLLMSLRRPDVWPAGDLGLVNSMQVVKRLRRPPSRERALAIAAAWRPYRAVAARMLWQAYLARQAEAASRRGRSTAKGSPVRPAVVP